MHRILRVTGSLLLALVLAPSVASAQSAAVAHDPAATITAETFYDRLYFIASDALRGRDTPSPGLEAAAAYLVSEHRRMGLQPAGDRGTYYQRWPYHQVGSDLDAAALTLTGAREVAVVPGENALVRGAADATLHGELVFVHSADGSPPAPGSLDGQVAVFPVSGIWSPQVQNAALRRGRIAEAAGAVATVHILDEPMAAGQMRAAAEQMARGQRIMGHALPHPQIFLTREAVLAAAPRVEGIIERANGESSFHEPLGAHLAGVLPSRMVDAAEPANVVAVLRGSDPQLRDEYVVLSAHYDHVGVGNPMDGDSIYNGADDNGSGTVALLEVARAISAMPEAPRRSVLFVHVSGEEKGLLGSAWFADQPTVPLEQMVANINADMIAGNAHRDTLVVIGKEYSTLGPLVDEINDGMPELNLTTSDDLWPEQRFFYRSDQLHFMRKEIPSLFFFTGVHECYHRPCDSVDFVDHDKAARVARLLTHSVLAIANADARPEWDPAGLAEVRELTGAGR